MAKYSKGAQKKVERAMKEKKEGTLKSGRSGKKVTSRKQAIAIGLSEARKKGAKVPRKRSSSRSSSRRKKAAEPSAIPVGILVDGPPELGVVAGKDAGPGQPRQRLQALERV